MNDLARLADEHLGAAKEARHGRSSEQLLHDGPLRQNLIAMAEGFKLDDHEPPVAAALLVLRGRVRLTAAGGDVELGEHQTAPIPHERHGLTALEDSVFILTTVTGV
ncbi:cupin [Glycomyces arizonensis]|uniref:cupin n=1 Tax=Glycomyces arizonensis TaxID=256035 RepID=UPI000417618F|nr:cupin [Glycomyces arizonensis]